MLRRLDNLSKNVIFKKKNRGRTTVFLLYSFASDARILDLEYFFGSQRQLRYDVFFRWEAVERVVLGRYVNTVIWLDVWEVVFNVQAVSLQG